MVTPIEVNPDSKIVDVLWLNGVMAIVLVETLSGNKAYIGYCQGADEYLDVMRIYNNGQKLLLDQVTAIAAHLMTNREGSDAKAGPETPV